MSRLDRLAASDRHRLLALSQLELARRRAVSSGTDWLAIARPEQLPPPGSWRTWLIMTGRGWGKTRTAAEAVAAMARDGRARRIAIVARTANDLRNISVAALQVAVGPSLRYYPSIHHKLSFPNGGIAFGFSATKADSFRGFEFDLIWFDELAAYPDLAVFDQARLALRAPGARQIITTTPRPLALLRRLRDDSTTAVTTGRTWDNAANLDPGSLVSYRQYEGTRTGRQEVEGELLEDLDGGLWSPAWIENNRVTAAPKLVRIVVAIDPAVGRGRGSDETGIIVAGKSGDGHGYLLADLSGRMTPARWARLAVDAYHIHGADLIVAEVNNGGDLVRSAIAAVDPSVPYRAVQSRESKLARAMPISGSYELGRVHHVGTFAALEDQLRTASLDHGSGPDDRLDAMVLAFTELDLRGSALDVPGMIAWQYGVWVCPCDHLYTWTPGARCPRCGRLAAATYPEPGTTSGGSRHSRGGSDRDPGPGPSGGGRLSNRRAHEDADPESDRGRRGAERHLPQTGAQRMNPVNRVIASPWPKIARQLKTEAATRATWLDVTRNGGRDAFALVDVPKLSHFRIGRCRELAGFDRKLVRAELAGALDREVPIERHRERAGHESG